MSIPHRVSPFGKTLRRYRVAIGLSQNALARTAGIDPAYVNRFETGKPGSPSRNVVLNLAEALGLDLYQTDRLLYDAGLAPQNDWQAIAIDQAKRLAAIEKQFIGIADLPTRYKEDDRVLRAG